MIYFSQEQDYTCAIACVRMCISAFDEDLASSLHESHLAEIAETTPDAGTSPDALTHFLNSLGYSVEFFEDASLDDVRLDKAKGYEIILLISVDVPHCVVYLDDNRNHLFYHDPYFGSRQSKKISKFISEKTSYPFARWSTDVQSLYKYFPQANFDKLSKYEGVRQYLRIKKVG